MPRAKNCGTSTPPAARKPDMGALPESPPSMLWIMDNDERDDTMPALGLRDPRAKVRRRLEELTRAAIDNPRIDLGLATRIGDALLGLLDAAAARDEDDQVAVRGVVEYFVLSSDEDPDEDSPHGFVDDAELLNDTCDQLGLPEFKVRIR